VDVLSSGILLRPGDLDRSRRFYRDVLGLAVYREFGPPDDPGVVFFLGSGFLEVSGHAAGPAGPERLLRQFPLTFVSQTCWTGPDSGAPIGHVRGSDVQDQHGEALSGHSRLFPKLIVRVRFPSPAAPSEPR
jgi:catechol 2,3-dioxygenase-like lactoylglutathione lyase family enzyme